MFERAPNLRGLATQLKPCSVIVLPALVSSAARWDFDETRWSSKDGTRPGRSRSEGSFYDPLATLSSTREISYLAF
jgi:hypothetical protein